MLVEDASLWIITELKKIDILPNEINGIVTEYANDEDAKKDVAIHLKSIFPDNVNGIINTYVTNVITFTLAPDSYQPTGSINMSYIDEFIMTRFS